MEIISGRNSSNLDYRNSKLSNIGRDNINIEQSKDEYAYQYQIIIIYSNKGSESRIELKDIVLLMSSFGDLLSAETSLPKKKGDNEIINEGEYLTLEIGKVQYFKISDAKKVFMLALLNIMAKMNTVNLILIHMIYRLIIFHLTFF